MDLEPVITIVAVVAGAVAGIVTGVLRFLDRRDRRREQHEMQLHIWASAERSRRRELKRARRESSGPKLVAPPAAPEPLDDEITDMHELVELERDHQRRRPGERAPRRGTHHD